MSVIVSESFCCLIVCVGVFLHAFCICILFLTVCHCGILRTLVVVAVSEPLPGVCERSADATSGQDNARAAPKLPPAL